MADNKGITLQGMRSGYLVDRYLRYPLSDNTCAFHSAATDIGFELICSPGTLHKATPSCNPVSHPTIIEFQSGWAGGFSASRKPWVWLI